jgi:glutamate dehydrogenase
VGEGANLAFTQRARVEYARRGGRINTDAIDNAAGVAISDREVNLKILLGQAVEAGALAGADRDRLLQDVADDVVAAVLDDVSLQTWAISRQVAASPARLDAIDSLLQHLEEADVVDRASEQLPTTAELHARVDAGAGLTRPEMAVVLAGAKRDLADELLKSTVPDSPFFGPVLDAYFPAPIVQRFGDLIGRHRLRRELVAASLTNDIVNRMGADFAAATATEAGVGLAPVVHAYAAAREMAAAEQWWQYLDHSDLAPDLLSELAEAFSGLLGALTRHYLPGLDEVALATTIARHRPAFVELAPAIATMGSTIQQHRSARRAAQLSDAGVDATWAVRFAGVSELAIVPDVADVAQALERSVVDVAETFLLAREQLGIDRVLARLEAVRPHDAWSRQAAEALRDDLHELCRSAARNSLATFPHVEPTLAIGRYGDKHAAVLDHTRRLLRQAEGAAGDRLEPLSVVVAALRRVVET